MDSQHLELDLHLLELRFAGSRLVEPRAVERIAIQSSAAVRLFLASWWLFPPTPALAGNGLC